MGKSRWRSFDLHIHILHFAYCHSRQVTHNTYLEAAQKTTGTIVKSKSKALYLREISAAPQIPKIKMYREAHDANPWTWSRTQINLLFFFLLFSELNDLSQTYRTFEEHFPDPHPTKIPSPNPVEIYHVMYLLPACHGFTIFGYWYSTS